MDRRRFIYGSTMSLLLANAQQSLLDRAIERTGGYRALRRIRRLMWTGQAQIFAPQGRVIAIGVRTEVVPFVSARSDSWLLSDGSANTNTLIIEPSEAWIIRTDRGRQAMSNAMATHERAQYALYGLMLLAPLRDPGAFATPGVERNTLRVGHQGAPETVFGFDDHAALTWATNIVPSAEGGADIRQHFTFEGDIKGGRMRWPQRIKIAQNGSPYFDLQLSTFATSVT